MGGVALSSTVRIKSLVDGRVLKKDLLKVTGG